MKRRTLSALSVLTIGLLAAALWIAGPASAHVTVSSPGAVQGGYATVTFKVPTESDTASTTGLKVQLPTDQPLSSVSVQPLQGWSYRVTKSGDSVATIEWTADDAASAIKPGEFQQFVISAGPLPKAPSMTFKAIQTYSDKSVVSWIEQPAPGSTAEPEHPAPTLTLAAAQTGAGAPASATPGPTGAASGTTAEASRTSDGDGKATTALVIGVAGLLLGASALAVAILRGARSRTQS